MADVLRSCSKTACRWPAAASLSYRYATRQVWLLDLAATRDPSLYDLCPHHADSLVVPKGWERVDHRTVQEVMVEPSADDRAEQAARRRISAADPGANVRSLVGAGARTGSPGRNRYAELIDQLPRLAAEAGVPGASHPAATITAAPPDQRPAPAPPPAPSALPAPVDMRPPMSIASEPPLPPAPVLPASPPADLPPELPAHTPQRHQAPGVRSGAPVPSRDLAPLPPNEPPLEPASGDDDALPGQLSIPVEFDDDDRGVVVPFDKAGSRRRTPRS